MSQRHLNQTLTYWAPSADTDRYGKPTPSTPVQMACRWEDRNEQLQSKSGEQFISKSRIFIEGDVDLDGYVYLGVTTETNPGNVEGSKAIQQVGKQPDLRNLRSLTVIYL